MSMDKQQVDNMFVSEDFIYDETLNIDRQILYTPDNNQGDYKGNLTFDMSSLKSKLVPLSEAKLVGGLRVTFTGSGGRTWTSCPPLAWTLGQMGLIYGVTVQANSALLINNLNIAPRNYVDYLENRTNSSRDGGAAWDSCITKMQDALEPYVATTTSAVSSDAQIMKQKFCAAGAVFFPQVGSADAYAVIPFDIALKDVDPFFAAMTSLITNVSWLFTFNLTMNSNDPTVRIFDMPPVLLATGVQAPANTSPASLYSGNLTITMDNSLFGLGNTCRIYYPDVTPNAVELEKINRRLNAGWTKEVEFLIPTVQVYNNESMTSQFSKIVTSAVVLPQKIHALVVPNNYWSPLTLASDGKAGVTTNASIPIPINNVQLQVDDKQYFSNVPRTFNEKWWLEKENYIDMAESDIFTPFLDRQDFRNAYAGLNTWDVSRLHSRIINPLAATGVNLSFYYGDDTIYATTHGTNIVAPVSSQRTNANVITTFGSTATVYVIVERLQKVRLDISKTNVTVVLGVSTAAGGR